MKKLISDILFIKMTKTAIIGLTLLSALKAEADSVQRIPAQAVLADHESIPEVLMNEFIVTTAHRHPLIQTYGVATCVAVVLYDRTTGVTALGHVSATTNFRQSLQEILRRMNSQGKNLQAQIIGGWIGWSEETVYSIESSLRRSRISVIRKEVLFPGAPSPNNPNQEIQEEMTPPLSLMVNLTQQAQVSGYVESIKSNLTQQTSPHRASATVLIRHPESL